LQLSDSKASALNVTVAAQGGAGGGVSWESLAPTKNASGGDASAVLTLSSGKAGAALTAQTLAQGGQGGLGGKASSTLTASGSGPLSATSQAVGGNGHTTHYANFAGADAGDAHAQVNVSGSGNHDVQGSSIATGGGFAYQNNGWPYGAAGKAVSSATGTLNGQGTLTISATATGGNGGGNFTGGEALATASGSSSTGATVIVTATQTGGKGGWGGGRGADSVMSNAVSGSTSGALTLNQNAVGGDAGSGMWTGNSGGAASSSLTVQNLAASKLTVNASAVGGAQDFNRIGDPAEGQTLENGAATALASARGNGVVSAGARATGGPLSGWPLTAAGAAKATALAASLQQGGSATAHASGTGNVVDVKAQASVVGSGTAAARADGAGTSGTLTASSEARLGSQYALAGAGAPAASGVAAVTNANYGGLPYATTLVANTVTSQVSGAPDSAAAEALLAVAPAVATAFDGLDVAGIGSQTASFGGIGSYTFTTSGAVSVTGNGGGHLLLGLLSGFGVGGGFSNLDFSVTSGGVLLFTQSFASFDAAQGFFNNGMLDLGVAGAGVHDVLVSTAFTQTAGQGYGFNYVIGVGNALLAPVPEPQTWAMMLLGSGVLVVARRRNKKERA
jgi:hypothetical protein